MEENLKKIKTVEELQTELRSILADCDAEQPDRAALTSRLAKLAWRLKGGGGFKK